MKKRNLKNQCKQNWNRLTVEININVIMKPDGALKYEATLFFRETSLGITWGLWPTDDHTVVGAIWTKPAIKEGGKCVSNDDGNTFCPPPHLLFPGTTTQNEERRKGEQSGKTVFLRHVTLELCQREPKKTWLCFLPLLPFSPQNRDFNTQTGGSHKRSVEK